MLLTDIGVEMCYRPLSHLNSNQHKDYSQRCCKTVTLTLYINEAFFRTTGRKIGTKSVNRETFLVVLQGLVEVEQTSNSMDHQM